MKIYVASKFNNFAQVRLVQGWLKERGHSITYDWTTHVEGEGEADKVACALVDIKGVVDADAVVLISVDEMRGAYVEMGAALAKNIPVHIVHMSGPAPTNQVFSSHPKAQIHATYDMLFAALSKPVETFQKFDSAKVRMELLPPAALEQVAKVFTYGAKKYSDENYLKGTTWRRYIGAALRHVWAFARGEDKDSESGESHLAHAVCCLLMLMELQRVKTGTDDRVKD